MRIGRQKQAVSVGTRQLLQFVSLYHFELQLLGGRVQAPDDTPRPPLPLTNVSICAPIPARFITAVQRP